MLLAREAISVRIAYDPVPLGCATWLQNALHCGCLLLLNSTRLADNDATDEFAVYTGIFAGDK
jgi:hypothetical protein